MQALHRYTAFLQNVYVGHKGAFEFTSCSLAIIAIVRVTGRIKFSIQLPNGNHQCSQDRSSDQRAVSLPNSLEQWNKDRKREKRIEKMYTVYAWIYGHQSHDPGPVLVKDENFKSVRYNTNKGVKYYRSQRRGGHGGQLPVLYFQLLQYSLFFTCLLP